MRLVIISLGLLVWLNAQVYENPYPKNAYLASADNAQTSDIQDETTSDLDNEQTESAQSESEESIGRTFTLAELIEGAKKNYSLEAKDLAILQAQANKSGAYSEFMPTIDGSYQYQYNNNSNMRLDGHTGNVKANWEFFSGLKTYNKVREKQSLYRASLEDKETTKDQLFLSIIEQYYTYFTNRARFLSLDHKRIQLQANVKRVERLFKAGLTTIDDLESLRAELLTTEHDIESVRLDIEKNKLTLSWLTNSDVGSLERKTIKTPVFNLNENRHDLNMLTYQAAGSKYQARQMTYLPTIGISDSYSLNSGFGQGLHTKGDTGGFDMSQMILRSYPGYQNVVMVTASIHLDALTTYRQYEAARLGYLQMLKNLAYKKEEQKKDERVYRKSLEIAATKIKASEAALRSANIAFENVAKKYDAQILNFIDYLSSLTKKFEAEATYNQALNDYEMQKAYYIYYSGQDLQEHIE
ncbi:TolC family protein [Helicobacter sp. MIT 05-5293]|uniref:TolC family protein n=1 Tax=Helicobacter sp. MIT 05-5293 TaxID=1548149 RepID=UPI0010FD0A63|nr:TolC family protein [Helicobacter sp. MIT 05-5293]TLD81823.1 TolC family protein [Helicobacter sp. MIT 05-5293]